ncbi:MAG: M28 family peptidase [Thermomicrobiales bacterium]|nr:M28 family peptidase [Thermomicrobiales bacterium]
MADSISDQVSTRELLRHTRSIAQWVRLSGTPDEAKAFEYIQRELESLGFAVTRYESDALIGYPGESILEVLGNERKVIRSNGYSLSPQTDADGVVGELVYVSNGLAGDYFGRDVRGKIALSDGLATPEKALAAQKHGAIGQVHINGKHIHEMCISPVWGTPTSETARYLPTVPAVAVTLEDGKRLKHLATAGSVKIRLFTQPFREWCRIPTLVADLPGTPGDHFVLFSGHVDSWHYGAMDNAAANATQLEVARLVAGQPEVLRRGLRLAFWSGHSHGRYASSAWYADTFWHDLYEHCTCHVNVDSVGAVGAEVIDEAPVMAETYDLARDVIHRITGSDLVYRRISRSSDQSFWGHGIPSLFGTFSEQLKDASTVNDAHAQLLGSGGRGGGLGWWWHTPDDTVDKLDPNNLRRDARIYAEAIWTFLTAPILPFNVAAAADEISMALDRYHQDAHGAIDLAGTAARARSLAAAIREIEFDGPKANEINSLLIDLNRLLIPVNYTEKGPFHQDPALGTPPVPGLAGAKRLGQLETSEEEFYFLRTQLVREQNRIEHALNSAMKRVKLFGEWT